ncbi:MAG: hypothetical protein MZV63_55735 [Marinilabiliales bacterium]|nr:hypothetical protein [Marinilabiliales bacterium]
MKLVLDLGNTNKKICVFQEGRLVHLEISDQLSLRTLKEVMGNYPDITDGIMASVVTIPAYLKNYLEQQLTRFIELNNRTSIPVVNKYKTPWSPGQGPAGLCGGRGLHVRRIPRARCQRRHLSHVRFRHRDP